jgi:hypothetical protein
MPSTVLAIQPCQCLEFFRCFWFNSGLFPGTPQIASSLPSVTLSRHASYCILLDHRLLCYPILPLFCLTSYYIYPYILLSTLPNFTSSNMEPMASQVRNPYSQKDQEAHRETALARALPKTANHHCRSNVSTSHRTFEYSVGDS